MHPLLALEHPLDLLLPDKSQGAELGVQHIKAQVIVKSLLFNPFLLGEHRECFDDLASDYTYLLAVVCHNLSTGLENAVAVVLHNAGEELPHKLHNPHQEILAQNGQLPVTLLHSLVLSYQFLQGGVVCLVHLPII